MLPADGSSRRGVLATATGDLNKDGLSDFVFATSSAAAILATSTGRGRFSLAAAPDGTAGATAMQLFDYDGDGLMDLLAFAPGGARLWRYLGSSWSDVTSAALPGRFRRRVRSWPDGRGRPGRGWRLRRYRAPAVGRVRFWRKTQPTGLPRSAAVRVRLDARVSNRSAIGAKVELRAGSLRERFEVSRATPPVAPADVVSASAAVRVPTSMRVLWPSGILQAEADAGPRRSPIVGARSQALVMPVSLYLEWLRVRVRHRFHGRRRDGRLDRARRSQRSGS